MTKSDKRNKFALPKHWGMWAGMGLVLILAAWHFLDVKDGAYQTGRAWLHGWYGLAVLWGLGSLGILGFLAVKRELKKPEAFFAASGLLLGILYLGVLPPLAAPDEVSHYISAYQLSNRFLGKEAADPDGRVYVRAQDAWAEDMDDVLADDGSGVVKDGDTVIIGQIVVQDTYEVYQERGLGGSEEPSGSREPSEAGEPAGGQAAAGNGEPAGGQSASSQHVPSYQPAVHTTPLAYIPQALGICLGRILGLGTLGLMVLGRLFNLAFYCAAGFFAIRRLPFGKEVYCGVGLLPMTLHLAASMSYDVMILALCGYFLAVCLDLAYRSEKVRVRDVAVLAAVMAVMGPCKMVYGVAAGFCLLIPVKKFGGWGKWFLSAAAVLGAFGAAMFFVNRQTVALYTGIQDRYITWAEEPGYSFAQLIHSPLKVLRLCYNTLTGHGEQLYSGMIGASLGNMDPVINIPYLVILALTVLLLILAMKKPGEAVFMRTGQKIWIWFLALLCLGGLMFSMLLAWTPLSATMIQGVQGRYLLPLLPALLMTVRNGRLVRTGTKDGGILFAMACLDVYGILRIFSIVCMRV